MTVSEDITPDLDGGVLKEIKIRGPNPNDKPWKGDRVWVNYTGTLENGTKFDSSIDRGEKFQFSLGKAEVIKGWDLGVSSMARGEVSVFKIKPDYAYGQSGKPPQIPENATLIFEVELCHFDGEDITKSKDGGIMKRIKETGEGFDHPNDGGSVTVDFIGMYNGKIFDERRKLNFTLGEGEEIGIPKGVELAIEKMKKKEKIEAKLASKYGFGSTGNPAKGIPPGAHLTYEIDLHSFERAKESWQMDAEMKVEQAKLFKNRGTAFFTEGKFELAANKYRKIVEFLEHELSLKGAIEEERKELLLAGRLNLAMCMLKQEDWIEARNMCNKVLEEKTDAPKAFFRRGEAHFHLKDFDLAIADFQTVLDLDPENKAAKNKIILCAQEIKAQKDRDKKTFANMFDKFAKMDAKKADEDKLNERQVDINDWSDNKRESLSVHGDLEMDMDVNEGSDEDDDDDDGQ